MVEESYGRPLRRPKRQGPPTEKAKAEESRQGSLGIPEPDKRPEEKIAAAPPTKPTSRPATPAGRDKPHTPPPPRSGDRKPGPKSRPPASRRDRQPPRHSKDRDTRRQPPRHPTKVTARRLPMVGLKLESIALPTLTVMAGTAFLYFSAPIMVPLVAAIAFAYVLSPVVDLLKRGKIPHVVAVLIVMLVGAVALAGAGYLIFQESVGLASEMPQYYETVKGWLVGALASYDSLQQSTGGILPVLDESLLENVTFTDFSGVGAYLFKGLGSVFSSVLGLALIVLLTLFLLLDQAPLRRRLALVLGGDPAGSARIIDDINRQIRGFMLVKFVTTVALAIIFTVGLLIFDVSYAYVWGPLAGVLNLIPYIGAFIGMVPPVIVAAIQTGGITIPFWVLLFMVVVQLLESNVITPKLVGDKVNLNLLAVLLATVYWGWLWGMLGVLLAIPITAAIKVICTHIEPLKPIAILLGGDPAAATAKAR